MNLHLFAIIATFALMWIIAYWGHLQEVGSRTRRRIRSDTQAHAVPHHLERTLRHLQTTTHDLVRALRNEDLEGDEAFQLMQATQDELASSIVQVGELLESYPEEGVPLLAQVARDMVHSAGVIQTEAVAAFDLVLAVRVLANENANDSTLESQATAALERVETAQKRLDAEWEYWTSGGEDLTSLPNNVRVIRT